jgi:hypothetical protein
LTAPPNRRSITRRPGGKIHGFSAVNRLAVIVAAVVAWLFGAA